MMAQLTNEDFRRIWERLYRPATGKVALKALPHLPTIQQLKAGFQAIEDALTTTPIPAAAVGATVPIVVKARFDAAIGQTSSTELFRVAFVEWLRWRVEEGR